MQQDFLFELGCEELPAGELAPIMAHLEVQVKKAFAAARLKHGIIKSFYTPRRLALFIPDLQAEVPAQILERRGPPKAAGFDKAGEPTGALKGFLKSAGAALTDLFEIETDKGIWLGVKIEQPARLVKTLLPSIISDAIRSLPLKKEMRWGKQDFSFLRPVHWLVALFGEEIVPVELFGLKAGRETFGHRFHHPQSIIIPLPSVYVETLRHAYVMVDREERRKTILDKISSEPCRLGKLEEVLDLVEWPVPLRGSFEKEFLSVPQEVLISTMEVNQRVFPILARDRLQNRFWMVANIESKRPESVIHGNERVVRARLADAKFFYDEDLTVPLEHHLSALAKITFQQGLGSLADKTARLEKLMRELDSGEIATAGIRAARLCKMDLVSGMVQEFPELQGSMGCQYALAQNENPQVAYALEDHYKPKGRGKDLPRNEIGKRLAIADKVDTLVGLFAIGKEPTSSGDPFALRRQALGIIAILVEGHLHLNLYPILERAYRFYRDQGAALADEKTVLAELSLFFKERMEAWCRDEKDLPLNVVTAILNRRYRGVESGFDPLDIVERIQALTRLLETEDGKKLQELAKRMGNLLDKAGKPTLPAVPLNPALFVKEEAVIYALFEKVPSWLALPLKAQYLAYLTFREPISHFFEKVLVNTDEPDLRQNRHHLLREVHRLFQNLADFSQL